MADLFLHIPNHGYSDEDLLFVSWLDANYYVSDKTQNAFKLTTTAGGAVYIQFGESVTAGFVREVTGSGITTITGLNHLEGELVQVTSNGIYLGLFTVASGSISVLTSVFSYTVGLPFESTLQPMKLDLSNLGLATTKKVSKVIISLNKTVAGKVGTGTQKLNSIVYRDAGSSDEEFPYFTGDREQTMPGGYSRAGDVMVKQDEPYPMTVLALTFDVGARND